MATHQKILKTEQKIKEAFIYLVNAKGIESLTISDITRYAHINRSTFYAHYLDKSDLVNHYENKVIEEIKKILDHNLLPIMKENSVDALNSRIYPVFNIVIKYVYSDLDLVKCLLGPMGDYRMELEVKKILNQLIDRDLFRLTGKNKMTQVIPNNYAHEIIVSQLIDIVKFWIMQDNPESPEKIAEIITLTRYLSPYDILGVNEKA